MRPEDARRKIDAAYKSEEKRLGLPISAAVRRYVEEKFEGAIESDEDLEAFIEAIPDYVGLIATSVSDSPLTRKPPQRSPGAPKKRRRSLYHAYCFDRRLRVFGFVAERAVDLEGLLQRRLYPARRIRWREYCAEYSEHYPYDEMTLANLKRTYTRAKGEEEVREAWFAAQAERYRVLLARYGELVEGARRDVGWWSEVQEEARTDAGATISPRHYIVLDLSPRLPQLLPAIPSEWRPAHNIPKALAHKLPRVRRAIKERARRWQEEYSRLVRASRPSRDETQESQPRRKAGGRNVGPASRSRSSRRSR